MNTVTVGERQIRAAAPMAEAIDAVRDALTDLAARAPETSARTVLRDGCFLVHALDAGAIARDLARGFLP